MSTRGFFGNRNKKPARPIPPGQYIENGFPVLSAGPTPNIERTTWEFTVEKAGDVLKRWSWDEILRLPATEMNVDIHCVTKWSKLDTYWKGVSIDTLLENADLKLPPGEFVVAFCEGGYTTNVPAADLVDGKAILAYEYDGQPLSPEHGGPARLFIPHLYFWKSAKWIIGMRFMDKDSPGFWESYGYHMYGDPWSEQRYSDD